MTTALQPCGHAGGCARRTQDPSRLCHQHRDLQPKYTPGRQLYFGAGGPLGAPPRLTKERVEPLPDPLDAADIDGFPYFTLADHKMYIDWRLGFGPRPSTADILDRYPVLLVEAAGSDVTGDEIAVYDASGRLRPLRTEPAVPAPAATGEPDEVRFLPAESGRAIAVRSGDVYQVVIFDRNRLGSHLP